MTKGLQEENCDHRSQWTAEPTSAAAMAVERGELMLSMLSQTAAAARAEARCAELRLLLAEARLGTSRPLEDWLHEQGTPAGSGSPSSTASSSTASSLTGVASLNATDSAPSTEQEWPIVSWEQFLPAARQRLQLRSPARSSPAPSSPGAVLSGRRSANSRPRRWRGVLFSIVVHVGLALLLGLSTLRLPAPPASLSLNTSAAETATESLQLSEPVELDAPQTTEQMSVTQPELDVSQNLSEVGAIAHTDFNESLQAAATTSTAAQLASTSLRSGGLAKALHSEASFFGAAASGNCFCYVIDGSGSMRGGPWEAAKVELFKSLANLQAKQRFYIIFFNRELTAISLPGEREPAARPLYATPENLQHARRWLDTLRIDIGGPPNAALELAIAKEPDAVYLLTDGVTSVDVVGFLRRTNRTQDVIFGEQIRAPIHSIAFYSLEGQALLQQISAENGGQFVYVPDPRKRP
jgi:hypothetical protein